MTFILPSDFGDGSPDPQLLNARFAAYREYLYSVREELPASAYEFAIADWHHDPGVPSAHTTLGLNGLRSLRND